jgi:replicative superfamily II helicase
VNAYLVLPSFHYFPLDMPLRATFVGINVYSDAKIADLTGAGPDATAMATLFQDSVPQASVNQLRDEQATAESIRDALDHTIGQAGPEDTALFFFAGHGSHSHHLVPSDAEKHRLSDTAIPMSELSERLNASEAKAAVIILDCCFSGAAPARVLEDAPVARDTPETIQDLKGAGRVIIAASRDSEPAYEVGRNGLLTKGLMRKLRSSEETVEVGDLMEEVSGFVQAEAERIGRSQTPVWFSFIEGHLSLPALQPGPNYADAFPETSGIQVSRDIGELSAFGIPEEVVSEWADRFPNGLNDLQLKAVNDHRVLDGKSLLTVAPTSAGKTFIGEMAGAKAVAEGRKVVFLLPYRALTNEKYEDFQAFYGDRLDMRVIRCTGDYTDDTSRFVRGKYDFAFLTYEMFLGLSVNASASLHKIGLVVVDETQFITDASRGISVELMLTNLLAAREKGVNPQILALSAVIGEVNHFDDWLGCDTLMTRERPVPLLEGVLDRSGTFQFIDGDGNEQTTQLLPTHAIRKRKKKKSSQDVIVPLARKLVSNEEKLLIFRNAKGKAAGCANYLANELGLPAATDVIKQLPGRDPSSTSERLREALQGGTAVHNANLSREERSTIEQAFRQLDGNVHVLAATTTVAAGVNTPASTVILAEHTFYTDDGPQDFTVAEYKNMAGRAGRLGIEEQGRSILLASGAVERKRLFEQYVRADPEPIQSSFDAEDLPTWILRLLAQVERVPEDEVVRLLASTYGGYLRRRTDPEWHEKMKERLQELLMRMRDLDLLEEQDGKIKLTLLGQACGESTLPFGEAMKLVEVLREVSGGRSIDEITAKRLMALLQMLSESETGYTPLFKRGGSRKESAWQRDVTNYYSQAVTRALQKRAKDKYEYWARCKRAAILWEWIEGVPTRKIEDKYTINPYSGDIGAGEIRRFADNTRFNLQSAFDIANLLLLGKGPNEEEVDQLVKRLEVGLPESALRLLNLPARLTRGEYLELHSAGYTEAEEVLNTSPEELRNHINSVNWPVLQQTIFSEE